MLERVVQRDHRWYGCKRDTRDPRDENFKFKAPHMALPESVDLSRWMPPVMNQGALGSCTANGITAALRFLLIKNGMRDVPLSRLQLYYDERTVENTVLEDAGAEIRDGIKSAFKLGVGKEELWPYNVDMFTHRPPQAVYESAVEFQGLLYRRVQVGNICVKTALALGFPVIIGITLFDSFESLAVEKTGVVPLPDINTEGMIGGHCMIIHGYGRKPGHYTTRNSWDDNWGDKGDCYLPENYAGSPQFGSDYWLIEKIG